MSDASNVFRWLLLDHQGLGMPIPAVYVPADDLAPAYPAAFGFLPVLRPDDTVPTAHNLAADISTPDRLSLVVVATERSQVGGGVTAAQGRELAIGDFDTPVTTAWREQVRTAGHLLVVTGPRPVDDEPVGALVMSRSTAIAAIPVTRPVSR